MALGLCALAAISCSRSNSPNTPQHLAILQFENLSADTSLDWMGRAFSEIISRELAGAAGLSAIPPSRVKVFDAAFGRAAGNVPGVSSERAEALAAGAGRLGYGEYWLRNGTVEARLTLEDAQSGKTRVIAAAGGDVLAVGDALARTISSQVMPYGTRNPAAVRAFVLGVQASNPEESAQRFRESLSVDPNFEPPYDGLAQQRLRQRDVAGALSVLEQALTHRDRMPALEGAQLSFEAANLRGDSAAKRQAIAEWARITPQDPAVWRLQAETAMSAHDYRLAVEAYQKAVELAPSDAALLNQLGYATAYGGNLEAAMRALRRYEVLRPADANSLDSMGDVNVLLGRLHDAEKFYLQAAQKDQAFLGGGEFRKAAMARLMSGDIRGADELEKQYLGSRAAAHDPLADYYQAEWLWVSGRRKEGFQRLEEFAQRAETGGARDAAAEAYGELAVWSVALGNRAGAAPIAQKAVPLAGPGASGTVAVARFLAQPSASALEWSDRAARAFPSPAARVMKDRALAYALLLDRQFAAAAELLKRQYENGAGAPDEETPLLLAWCLVETGRAQEATGLLRFNPLPPSSGVRPFQVFYFPRLFYLRGRAALAVREAGAGRAQHKLFLQLSGETPLAWGEEKAQ
ncbi:MAG TPA: hypothetical protein VKT49_00080 [Bryobacteraceae bacterium]|nr:hypothetical protein [Bryobacteraceae bacterium]